MTFIRKVSGPIFMAAVFLAIFGTPAFACSCGGVATFEEVLRDAPVVVVGRVTSVGEIAPDIPPTSDTLIIVRPRLFGRGIRVAVASIAKGDIPTEEIRIWDSGYGECGSGLWRLTRGDSLVVAVGRIKDISSADFLGSRGVAPPETDYLLARGACGTSFQSLGDERELTDWLGRRLN